MLVYAIIAAKSTSIWPDLSYEDWATGNDDWKNVQILLGIIWINLLCQPNAGCQVIFLVEGPLVRIRMAITQGASCCFFKCVCVCVFFLGRRSRVTLPWGVPWFWRFEMWNQQPEKTKHRSWHRAFESWRFLNYSHPIEIEMMMGTLNLKLMMGTNMGTPIFGNIRVGMVTFQRLLETLGGSVSL